MIKFPKHHIATSVVNRILNMADGIEADRVSAAPLNAPPLPDDIALQSQTLNTALQTPPAETIPLNAAPDPGGTVAGKPLLATMLDPE